jgi:hypothetical protein
MEFSAFSKNLPCVASLVLLLKKIDGTNAQICITEEGEFFSWIAYRLDYCRKRIITGLLGGQTKNKEELLKLGVGSHFGEWWGQGVQTYLRFKKKSGFRFSIHLDGQMNQFVHRVAMSFRCFMKEFFDTRKNR